MSHQLRKLGLLLPASEMATRVHSPSRTEKAYPSVHGTALLQKRRATTPGDDLDVAVQSAWAFQIPQLQYCLLESWVSVKPEQSGRLSCDRCRYGIWPDLGPTIED